MLFSDLSKLEICFSLNHVGADEEGSIFRIADGWYPARSWAQSGGPGGQDEWNQ